MRFSYDSDRPPPSNYNPRDTKFITPEEVIADYPLFAQDLASWASLGREVLKQVELPTPPDGTDHLTNVDKHPCATNFLLLHALRTGHGYGVHFVDKAVGIHNKPANYKYAIWADSDDHAAVQTIYQSSTRSKRPTFRFLYLLTRGEGIIASALTPGHPENRNLLQAIDAAFPDPDTRPANLAERTYLTAVLNKSFWGFPSMRENFDKFEQLRPMYSPLSYEILTGLAATSIRQTIAELQPAPPHNPQAYWPKRPS